MRKQMTSIFCKWEFFIEFTRVRLLASLVSNSLIDSLLNSLLFSRLDWCDPGVWRCQVKTSFWLLLLLMLVLRNVLTTVWCRFRSWSLVIHYITVKFLFRVWAQGTACLTGDKDPPGKFQGLLKVQDPGNFQVSGGQLKKTPCIYKQDHQWWRYRRRLFD